MERYLMETAMLDFSAPAIVQIQNKNVGFPTLLYAIIPTFLY